MDVTIWFDTKQGARVFYNTTSAYFRVHQTYPMVTTQLPKFLSESGYKCSSAQTKHECMIGNSVRMADALGLTMDEEDATAFILRWA